MKILKIYNFFSSFSYIKNESTVYISCGRDPFRVRAGRGHEASRLHAVPRGRGDRQEGHRQVRTMLKGQGIGVRSKSGPQETMLKGQSDNFIGVRSKSGPSRRPKASRHNVKGTIGQFHCRWE